MSLPDGCHRSNLIGGNHVDLAAQCSYCSRSSATSHHASELRHETPAVVSLRVLSLLVGAVGRGRRGAWTPVRDRCAVDSQGPLLAVPRRDGREKRGTRHTAGSLPRKGWRIGAGHRSWKAPRQPVVQASGIGRNASGCENGSRNKTSKRWLAGSIPEPGLFDRNRNRWSKAVSRSRSGSIGPFGRFGVHHCLLSRTASCCGRRSTRFCWPNWNPVVRVSVQRLTGRHWFAGWRSICMACHRNREWSRDCCRPVPRCRGPTGGSPVGLAGYGERWARHWLDVSVSRQRRGDPEGSSPVLVLQVPRLHDPGFECGKPWNEFVIEQRAGDELVPPPHQDLSAERARPVDCDRVPENGARRKPGGSGANQELASNQVVAEVIKVVSTSLLGLTSVCSMSPASVRSDHPRPLLPAAGAVRARLRPEALAIALGPTGFTMAQGGSRKGGSDRQETGRDHQWQERGTGSGCEDGL
ncbi:MAG: hypothetical protein CM1200mP2_07050 [Planctomycetaceae bacterium]|nr:MAG: hypothetical protein CM1200mP2_07050 [Planctomycetaceae bacterium]